MYYNKKVDILIFQTNLLFFIALFMWKNQKNKLYVLNTKS